MGGSSNSGTRRAASQMRKSRKTLEGVSLPDIERMKIDPEEKKLLQELVLEKMGDTALEDISLDPKLRESQMRALERIEGKADRGLDDSDLAILRQTRRGEDARAKAQQDTILSQMAQRGALDSGASLQAQLSAAQSSAQRGAEATDRQAIAAAQARQQAAAQAANLASGMEQSDWGRQSQVASAKDRISQFNVGLENQARMRNIAERQRLAEGNIDARNRADLYNKQLLQQDFENRFRKAGGIAGTHTNMAQVYANQPQQASGFDKLLAAGATGAQIYAAAQTGGASTAAQKVAGAEDGGIIHAKNGYQSNKGLPVMDYINNPVNNTMMSSMPPTTPLEIEPSKAGVHYTPATNEVSDVQQTMDYIEGKLPKEEPIMSKMTDEQKLDLTTKKVSDNDVEPTNKVDTVPKKKEPKKVDEAKRGKAIASALSSARDLFGEGGSEARETKLDSSSYYIPNSFKLASPYEDGGLTGEQRIQAMMSRKRLIDPSPYAAANMEDGGYKSPYGTRRMEDGSLDFTSDGNGDIVEGDSFERDRVDARLNSGEAVLNVAQQQRLMDLLRGKISPEDLGDEDIVEGVPADYQDELTDEIDNGKDSKSEGLKKLLDILGE